MSAAEPKASEERVRFANVRAPQPVLAPETEQGLTPRQRQVLDQLEDLVTEDGLAALTMGQIAAHMGCSLRTLYGISPSKEELVLAAVDRNLRRIGREAIESLDPTMPPLEMLRAYLRAARSAFRALSAQALADVRSGVSKGIQKSAESATVAAVAGVAGYAFALAAGLPGEYLADIECVAATIDPDQQRAAEQFAIHQQEN